MITSTNPASVSVPCEGSARFNVGTCCTTEVGNLIMPKRIEYKHGDLINGHEYLYDVEQRHKQRRVTIHCKHCGKIHETSLQQVKVMNSCGCQTHLYQSGVIQHGLSGSRLYKKWKAIKRRCYNQNESNYKIYGGKGIRVCDEWFNDPLAFVTYCKSLPGWDNPDLTIDRIDSSGDYEPGNLRWATSTVQARNIGLKSNNKSGFTGVRFEHNKYSSCICVNYKQFRLGRFSTALEAAKSRDKYIIDNKLEGFNLQVL